LESIATTRNRAIGSDQLVGNTRTTRCAEGVPSDGPGVFSSQDIEAEVARRQQEFDAFAQGLRASGQRVLSAIDRRDVEALLKEGAAMDGACEACHRSFWYPHEVIPALPAELPPIQ